MLEDDRLEVLDIAVRAESRLARRPLAELPPTTSVIGVIVRDGELLFPRGEEELQVVAFAARMWWRSRTASRRSRSWFQDLLWGWSDSAWTGSRPTGPG
jgi:hypothetical protein